MSDACFTQNYFAIDNSDTLKNCFFSKVQKTTSVGSAAQTSGTHLLFHTIIYVFEVFLRRAKTIITFAFTKPYWLDKFIWRNLQETNSVLVKGSAILSKFCCEQCSLNSSPPAKMP